MTLDDLKTLLDFHYWARDRVLDAAAELTPEQFTRNMGSSFASIRDTLAHIYSSETVWYQRWHGTSPTAHLPFDQFPDIEAIRLAWTDHEARVRAFVNALGPDDVTRVIEFNTLTGEPSSAQLAQMIQHIANHGSYHRGQITTMLRQLGAKPAKSVDLIAYFRAKGPRA